MNYIQQHLKESIEIIQNIDTACIEDIVHAFLRIKHQQGRVFCLGVGGSAANCAHAVNDFRKILGIESYAPTDNIAELTARTNDEGWASVFVEWLKISRLTANDMLFILSVGGGNLQKNISPNLVMALDYAKQMGATITGIVGRDGGHTAKLADHCLIIPTVNPNCITPHAEAFQSLIWHLIVSHPKLQLKQPKWESEST